MALITKPDPTVPEFDEWQSEHLELPLETQPYYDEAIYTKLSHAKWVDETIFFSSHQKRICAVKNVVAADYVDSYTSFHTLDANEQFRNKCCASSKSLSQSTQ